MPLGELLEGRNFMHRAEPSAGFHREGRQEKYLLPSHGRAYNSAFDLDRREECFVSEKFGEILNTSLDRERKFQDFLNIFIHSFIHSSFTPQIFFNIYT